MKTKPANYPAGSIQSTAGVGLRTAGIPSQTKLIYDAEFDPDAGDR